MEMRVGIALLLIFGLFAGCLDGGETSEDPIQANQSEETRYRGAVLAVIDTGINPYHIDFRDNGTLGYVHPSKYLKEYPADIPALNLTLDAADMETAREADKQVWENVTSGQLYWIPGTKIVGAITFDGGIFDTGHGTMTSGRAAGNGYSLCPECRLVMVQGFTGQAVRYAADQVWIDMQSNSWSPAVVLAQADAAQEPGLADAFEYAASKHVVFGSAGNGIAGKFGVVGHPSFTRSTSGPRGVFSVGGHDNGDVILWSGSIPHMVADACANWAPVGFTMDLYTPYEGGGTSSASPYAMGGAGHMLSALREYYDIDDQRPADQKFYDSDQEVITHKDLVEIMMRTATPRPVKTFHDGDNCGMLGAPYNTYPIAWEDIPEDVPTYNLIGWGQISVDSVEYGIKVITRQELIPDRTNTELEEVAANQIREAYYMVPR